MKNAVSLVDLYLGDVAKNLEVLGADETREVVSELRSHIAEAVSDSGGDEQAALLRFDPAATLALSILEERGIATKTTTLPDAPGWLRRLALTLDIAVTATLLVLSAGFIAAVMWLAASDDLPRWPLILLLVLIPIAAILLVWSVARWIRARRPGRTTLGMGVLGLQRVRIGATTRLVRRRDLPGLPATTMGRLDRILRLACITLAFAVLAGATAAAVYAVRSQHVPLDDGAAIMQAPLVSLAMGQIDELYYLVTNDCSAADVADLFSPACAPLVTQLLSRRDSGKLATYEVTGTRWLDASELPIDPGREYEAERVFMSVRVVERDESRRDAAAYEYVLALVFNGVSTDRSSAQIMGTVKIVGARIIDEPLNKADCVSRVRGT